MRSMSTPIPGGVARRVVAQPIRTRKMHGFAPATGRLAGALWVRDRGIADLRGAAITLATMAALGMIATLLDPGSGAFLRVVLTAVPAAILVGAVAWSPLAPRLGRSMRFRMLLGPAVLIVAIVGRGPTDLATLQIPAAGMMILLAMAYAAITPGYLIAAAIVIRSSAG